MKNIHEKSTIFLFISSIVLMFGVFFNLQILSHFIPEELSKTSYFFIIAGFLGMLYSFKDLDLFSEAEWKDSVSAILILRIEPYKILYEYFINEKRNELIAQGIVGASSLISEIHQSLTSGSKNVSSIHLGKKILMLEKNENFIFCLLAQKKMITFRYFLRRLLQLWVSFNLESLIVEEDSAVNQILGDFIDNIFQRQTGEKKE